MFSFEMSDKHKLVMPGTKLIKHNKLNLSGVALKPSQKSKVLNTCVLSSFSKSKNVVDKSNVLYELIRNIFIGDEVSIKDYYSTLVTYFMLNVTHISYDNFSGAYESAKLGCQVKHNVCWALPYGALISSGLILKWEPEQQNQVVSKMLKIYQNHPESKNIVFHFLIALEINVKLRSRKLKKITIDSPILLYFVLSIDSKQDSGGDTILGSDDVLGLTEIYLQESEGFELIKRLSVLLAKKLLASGTETLLKFWNKLMESYDNPRNDYKDTVILHLLSSILENCSQNEILREADKLFTPAIVKILSKASPKIEPFFKSINLSLGNLAQNLSGTVKLSLIDVILVNAEKYLEKSPVVKICDTLALAMTFEEVSQSTELYRQVIMGEKHKAIDKSTSENSGFSEFEKICCVRFFGKLISLNACKYQLAWRKTQLKFLFEIGFLNDHKEFIGSHIAEISKSIFYSSLNKKFANLIDLDSILKKLVKFACDKMGNEENNFTVPFKKDAYKLWCQALDVVKTLKKSDDGDKLVFKVLLRYMMLFMLSNYFMAKNSLEELFRVIENKQSEVSKLHWSEVTVDVFLHLLSGSENIHKNVIHSTFTHVCKHLTQEGLGLILSAVKGKDSDNNDAGATDDSSGDEEVLNDSDEEDTESDEEEDDSESQSNDDENEGQMDKLKDALRQQLYSVDTASTCGSVDLDDLSEDEGKQLNSTLGEIFKARHAGFTSSAKIKVDNVQVHFRLRALNLLEIFIENEPSLYSSTLILTNIISLLKVSIPDHSLDPFTVGLKRCLKKLTNLKKFSDLSCITETSFCSAFNEILIRNCPVSTYQDMTEQIVDSCMFLIRCSAFVSQTNCGEMALCLKSTLENFFKGADSSIPFLLLNSIFSCLTIEKLLPLMSKVTQDAFSLTLKPHKRTQALQLLITFYNNNRLFKNISTFQKTLVNLEGKIINNSLKFISKINETELNKKYGCMYLDLLALLKAKNKLLANSPSPHWNDVTAIINILSAVPIFQKELKISFVNLCKIFNHDIGSTITKSSESVLKNGKRKKNSKEPSSSKKKKQKQN